MSGRLDGVTISPFTIDGKLTHLHLNFDTLPGMGMTLEIDAAVELRDALCQMLSGEPCVRPCGDVACGPAGGNCARGARRPTASVPAVLRVRPRVGCGR